MDLQSNPGLESRDINRRCPISYKVFLILSAVIAIYAVTMNKLDQASKTLAVASERHRNQRIPASEGIDLFRTYSHTNPHSIEMNLLIHEISRILIASHLILCICAIQVHISVDS